MKNNCEQLQNSFHSVTDPVTVDPAIMSRCEQNGTIVKIRLSIISQAAVFSSDIFISTGALKATLLTVLTLLTLSDKAHHMCLAPSVLPV